MANPDRLLSRFLHSHEIWYIYDFLSVLYVHTYSYIHIRNTQHRQPSLSSVWHPDWNTNKTMHHKFIHMSHHLNSILLDVYVLISDMYDSFSNIHMCMYTYIFCERNPRLGYPLKMVLIKISCLHSLHIYQVQVWVTANFLCMYWKYISMYNG